MATGGKSSGETKATGGSHSETTTSASSGGKSSTGGSKATGGSVATGGSKATGGSVATGGNAGGGSSATTGGSKAAGGSAAAGGSKASGGSSAATGGSKATGGGAATGGGSSVASSCTTDEEKKFSFFLVSQAALQADSGKTDGYGGKLGGLAGADAICQRVAEKSSPCQSSKTWHAFLSTSTQNAKDRIGSGPWYDRLGRVLAQDLTGLLEDRPKGADTKIANDFPNEDGVPNHSPDGSQVDNHEILTGTGTDGKVYTQAAGGGGGGFGMGGATSCGPSGQETWSTAGATCWDWTTNESKGCPRVGHSWPASSGTNWMSVWNESGCAPGGTLSDMGMPTGDTRTVGSYGGYGGFYCFAVTGK